MTQTANNYGKVLQELPVSREVILQAKELLEGSAELRSVLESPLIPFRKKESVIRRIFPGQLTGFFSTVCRYGHASLLGEIFLAYEEYENQKQQILNAVLYYVTKPTEEQLLGMKAFLCRRYHTKDAAVKMIQDKNLVGGFILRVKDQEFDYSLKGRIDALQQKLTWR